MRTHPFTVDIAQELLVDLLDRLARTRWPSEIAGSGWRFGADLNYLRTLLSYWQHEFDWRAQERRINGFANFHAEVDDIGLHFIHERGEGPHPIPLLLIHGWPSSFVEMLELIPLLTDPASHGMDGRTSFDVVVPSLPGYGFSDRLAQPGAPARRNGELLTQLMAGLGYERFAVHAYDIGASIAGNMALDYPERLIGYHTTEPFMPRPYPYLGDGARELTDAERTHIAYDQQWTADEGGYMAIQRTRPQSLAYGLNDSPVGLAAWIVEK